MVKESYGILRLKNNARIGGGFHIAYKGIVCVWEAESNLERSVGRLEFGVIKECCFPSLSVSYVIRITSYVIRISSYSWICYYMHPCFRYK